MSVSSQLRKAKTCVSDVGRAASRMSWLSILEMPETSGYQIVNITKGQYFICLNMSRSVNMIYRLKATVFLSTDNSSLSNLFLIYCCAWWSTMITTNIFIGTILWSVSVSGCGISTHTEIGYRAIEYFARDSNDNTDFIRNILMKHQVNLILSICPDSWREK